jgi:hypothetical protein
VIAVIAACASPAAKSTPEATAAGARSVMTEDQAVTTLRDMPAWAELAPGDSAGAARIESALSALAALDDDSLRRVVVRYVNEERARDAGLGVQAASRLYVLVRYVYAAPARAPGGVPRFAAFAGIPHGTNWVDEQWPLTADARGHLHLTGEFGGYQGEDYLAVEELDAFRTRYGRRTP